MSDVMWCLFLSPGGMRGGRKVIVEPHKHKGKCTHTMSCDLSKVGYYLLSCEAKIEYYLNFADHVF